MEQTNRKKGIYILLIVIIAIMFVLGIIFTIVKDNQYDKADKYNQSQSQLDDYYSELEKD